MVLGLEQPGNFFVRQERRGRKECSSHGHIKARDRVPEHVRAKFWIKKRVSRIVVVPRHFRLAPRGGVSCLSAVLCFVGTTQGPCGHGKTSLVVNFDAVK